MPIHCLIPGVLRCVAWCFLPYFALLSGCANLPPDQSALAPYFNDQRFIAPAHPIDDVDPFALSDAMRSYLGTGVNPILHSKSVQRALFDALYIKGQLKLEYDASITRNAAQTFAAHAGNCLSLVIMTAAFAKELNLAVTYNVVAVDDAWVRNGDLRLSVGHVNLTLGKRQFDDGGAGNRREVLTIDFLPPTDLGRLYSREISEATVVAMYMNNRAVEFLSEGNVDEAYWWARGAILRDRAFLSAFNTLAVVYQRHSDSADAERILAYVLQRDPVNTTAMSNRIAVLQALGRPLEARAMALALSKLQPIAPFQSFDEGIVAMRRGEFELARTLFIKELQRDPEFADAQYWLASAYLRLGDTAQASRYLREAIEHSTTLGSRDMYVAKLKRLKEGR